MRPTFLYVLFFAVIATAFVALAPTTDRHATAIPREALAPHRAAAITTRITFTSEAVPVAHPRALPAVANLQEPGPLESFASRDAIASAHAIETDGTH